jgi:ribonuclease Z
VLQVHEAWPDGRRRSARFCSDQAFAREDERAWRCDDDVLHEETMFRVRARFVDHEMPVLAFALEEKARLHIASDRLAAAGLASGPWLGALKRAVLSGAPLDTPIAMQWRDRGGLHEAVRSVRELQRLVLDAAPGRRVGYVTDLRFTEANLAQLQALLCDVDLLHIESVFLHEDRAHAERKNHLTARQAGEVARRLRAKALVPFHFSPRYQGRQAELVDEARQAWAGPAPVAATGV